MHGALAATGHFQQVIAELGFNRALKGIHFRVENYFVEFFDHHAGPELTQVSALRFRRTAGELSGNVCKVLTVFNLLF